MIDSTALILACGGALILCGLLLVGHSRLSLARAEARAERLMCEMLTSDELRQLRMRGYLDVVSRATANRFYRIPAEPGAVTVIEGGEVVARLCLVPVGPIPLSEQPLVHKLLLEGAEDEYWRRANRLGSWWNRSGG